jgi:hypothetical protein
METENFINKLLISSINHMKTNSWEWPEHWDTSRKLRFLDQCLKYAEQNEFYEQCAIIRDVQQTINI